MSAKKFYGLDECPKIRKEYPKRIMAAPTPQVMVDDDTYKEGLAGSVGTYKGTTKVGPAAVKSTVVVGPSKDGKYPLEMRSPPPCASASVLNEKSEGAVEADKTIILKSKDNQINATLSSYVRDELSPHSLLPRRARMRRYRDLCVAAEVVCHRSKAERKEWRHADHSHEAVGFEGASPF